MVRRELVSASLRRQFRDLASDAFVLREIEGMWQDEGFAPSEKPNREHGQRRTRFREYEDAVNWTDHDHVARALRVFETMLQDLGDDQLTRWRQLLERDGFILTAARKIVAPVGGRQQLPASLKSLRDPSVILDSFDRIGRALPEDPALAIGSAKELIEATAKTVLIECGLAFDENAKLPALVDTAQRALHLHPATATPGPDGTDAIKRILGGLTNIAVGVAELRNRGYGTGHAPTTGRVGLHPRHAYLAVGAAHTWCQLLLDTLADPAAPWRGRNSVLGHGRIREPCPNVGWWALCDHLIRSMSA